MMLSKRAPKMALETDLMASETALSSNYVLVSRLDLCIQQIYFSSTESSFRSGVLEICIDLENG